MAEIKNILAATDLSSNSSQAIDRGFRVARDSGARLDILHAVGIDALAPLREFLREDAEAVSQRILDEASDRLTELVADSPARNGVPANLHVERGLAGTAIPLFVERAGVDLVVVGAHGKGFLQRMLLGSTASRLLRKCQCPVLVVKQEAHGTYKRALVAVDFSPGSQATVRIAREVAPNAGLVLLHVFDVPFEGKMQYAGVSEEVLLQYRIEARARAVQQLRELAELAGLTSGEYSGLVVHGDATRNIMEHEEKYRCDLIVMGKHGTHVTEELLLGSVTKRVLAESLSDVLVVVDKRRRDFLQLTP